MIELIRQILVGILIALPICCLLSIAVYVRHIWLDVEALLGFLLELTDNITIREVKIFERTDEDNGED